MIQYRISVHSLRVLNGKNKSADFDQLLEREMQSDREKIDEMKLDEQVAYSTVQLQVYGPDQVSILKVPSISLDEYSPTMAGKFGAALSGGWTIIIGLLLGLIYIWPVLLILMALWIILRRRYRNKKTVS